MGETQCQACVPGGVCNGSAAVLTAANWWRAHNNTLTFFQCGPAEPCLGGRLTGTCKPQFTGPLCGVCAAGHAGEDCEKCGDRVQAQFMIGLIGFAYFLVIGVVILKAVRNTRAGKSKGSELIKIFKIALTYLQVSTRPFHFHRKQASLVPEYPDTLGYFQFPPFPPPSGYRILGFAKGN